MSESRRDASSDIEDAVCLDRTARSSHLCGGVARRTVTLTGRSTPHTIEIEMKEIKEEKITISLYTTIQHREQIMNMEAN